LDVLVVAEVIISENRDIIISWNKTWNDKSDVCLYNKDNKLLGQYNNEITRYLARAMYPLLYGGTCPYERTEIDHWISCALVLQNIQTNKDLLNYLNNVLIARTWLVTKRLTLADIHVFCVLYRHEYIKLYAKDYCNITRWYKHMESLPVFNNAISMITKNCSSILKPKDISPQKEKSDAKQTKTRKQEGKFIDLPGAEMGKVVVRFPPEASGYLHIGHAKAALLNQYYAEAFQGQLIMRFDDTNPAKETVEFEEAILEDLKLLQIKPDRFTHTSDYFDLLQEYCTTLIKDGKAYLDCTPANLMKEQRDKRLKSEYRDLSPSENLQLWEEMKRGTEKGQEYCVRAKIDYQSTNGCMRDPTIYRCKLESHPRTGNKYKIYPTYDFACPIVDVIENVTHTLRTTEYHDRDVQFYWIIEALGLRRPYIWEYSRLNMTHTVLSKRKLTWFVNEGLVDDWDDPRFPTVRGILRRGMTVEGLKQFIIAQGSSRSVVFMEWDKIWAFNKKVIDPVAIRYTALDYNELIPVNVIDAKQEWLSVQNHPKDLSKGTKQVRVSSKILIEKEDAERLIEGQNATFINWGNIMIQKINKQGDKIVDVEARLNLEDKNYKNTLKITWLAESLSKSDPNAEKSNPIKCYAVYFGHIMSVPVLGKDDDFKNFVAKDTRKEIRMLGEVELTRVKKGEIIQLQRKGFFICDVPYASNSYSTQEQPIILFHIPDGHTTTPYITPAVSYNQQNDPVNLATRAELISKKIKKQSDEVQNLKSLKVDKNIIEQEVKILLILKSDYKIVTGQDWKPADTKVDSTEAKPENKQILEADKISEEIKKQGDKVRNLKSSKANKSIIDQEVKVLLSLKSDFKNVTGQDWKPADTEVASTESKIKPENKGTLEAEKISGEIKKQGDKVRTVKSSKADKSIIDQEVKILLSLKSDYKNATGQDWKPTDTKVASTESKTKPENKGTWEAEKISEEIKKQGDKVRNLKSSKTNKSIIDQEVKVLLNLKSDFKNVTGQDWKPADTKVASTGSKIKPENKGTLEADKISEKIKKQGDKVRNLKNSKADKIIIDQEVKVLLSLKSDYKNATGQDWKPADTKVASTGSKIKPENKETSEAEKVSEEIKKQGDKVRNLKSSKADKSIIDQEVKVLLSLKSDYKNATGQDWKPVNSDAASKKEKQNTSKLEKTSEKEVIKNANNDSDSSKTGTRLGLEAKKEENFTDWYSQVITKSGMIEYYDVSGCYILRPWSFSIWKIVKEFIDKEITDTGVQECYFPIFVTRSVLEKEKAHITDFAPEVAWVTKYGETDLAEPIAIRPTSETIMYPAYAKWLRSDTELPLRLNQWNNVVRWEFKDPKPFLRTREFLWQEGHTAFATKAEAEAEVLMILDLYARVYEDLLAVPVIKGRKTEKEKFAGGEYTTTVEAFIPINGRAIQGATSHYLGQNFSKMFNIQVEGIEGREEKTFVYQNSWGLTTRTIGVMIMVHGDDRGLVLPPNIAPIQIIVIPCGIAVNMDEHTKESILKKCDWLVRHLGQEGKFRVKSDCRFSRTPGWKFNHWELKGVPIRLEVGPKDLLKNQVTVVRRDNSQRTAIEICNDNIIAPLTSILNDVQRQLLSRARSELNEHIKQVEKWSNFNPELNKKNLLLAPFCGDPACEDKIKEDSKEDKSESTESGSLMGAKSLCIPFDQPKITRSLDELKCIHHSCRNKPKFYTLFGRSY
ncbi:Bifunctional aminoacyl-tRNA synthetase, partial [Cyphomyrmex costatus]